MRHVSLAAAALCVLAGACNPPRPAPGITGPADHEIRLDRTRHAHRVTFPRGRARLSAGARADLRRFLNRTGARPSDRIVVTAPRGDLGTDRRHALMRFLRGAGYRPVEAVPGAAAHPGGEPLVRVTRYHASLPRCPDMRRTRMNDFHNLPTSNFGCATKHNLGRMVANPSDLARGPALAPAGATRESRSVKAYRAGKQPKIERAKKRSGGFTFQGKPKGGGGGSGS